MVWRRVVLGACALSFTAFSRDISDEPIRHDRRAVSLDTLNQEQAPATPTRENFSRVIQPGGDCSSGKCVCVVSVEADQTAMEATILITNNVQTAKVLNIPVRRIPLQPGGQVRVGRLMDRILALQDENGNFARYMGTMVTWALPTQEDHVIKLMPGESASVVIDLASNYDLLPGHSYSVSIDTSVLVADMDQETIELLKQGRMMTTYCCFTPPVGHRRRTQETQTVRNGLSLDSSCNRQQRHILQTAFSQAVTMLGDRLASPCYQSQSDVFFGIAGYARARKKLIGLADYYSQVVAEEPTQPLVLACPPLGLRSISDTFSCPRSSYAFVRPYDANKVIHLCPLWFEKSAVGPLEYNDRPGALVHESLHFQSVGATLDVVKDGISVYGLYLTLELAQTNPDDAVINSENYNFFVEASCTPTVFMNGIPENEFPDKPDGPALQALLVASAQLPAQDNIIPPDNPRAPAGLSSRSMRPNARNTESPTESPTTLTTKDPTEHPTEYPTESPTQAPTLPTDQPTPAPSVRYYSHASRYGRKSG